MQVQHGREVAGRHAGKEPYDAEDEPLGASHAKIVAHPFRRLLQRVHDRPQQLHELQHVRQVVQVVDTRGGSGTNRHRDRETVARLS